MNDGILLHFIGEGRSFMAGVKEYFTFHTVDEDDIRDPAPGFTLENEIIGISLPVWFPEETSLAPR